MPKLESIVKIRPLIVLSLCLLRCGLFARERHDEFEEMMRVKRKEKEDEREDKEEDEGGQQLFAPVTTYHPEQLEATTMDLFSLDDGLQPLQNFDASRLSRSFEPSEPSPRRVSDSPTLELA